MYKKFLFNTEAREKILKGVNIVADAVVSTLGPRGQNVIFEESSYPTITKDGVTVAQQVFVEDKFENMGVMIAREAAENTNREAGDGTTTTIALLRDIVTEGHKRILSGMNSILLKRGMDDAVSEVIENLNKQSKPVKSRDQKLQIATISANNDPEMGEMIVDVIDKVGVKGVVTVSTSNSIKTEVEYVNGTKLNSGHKVNIFINDAKRLASVQENPVIITTTDDINLQSQLVPLIQSIIGAEKRTIILFANKIEGQALSFLVNNAIQGKFICVPIDLPSFGQYQKDFIYDLATLVGSTVLGESEAKPTTEGTIEDCGTAKQVVVYPGHTVVIGTKGDAKERIEQVDASIEKEKDLFKKEKLKERLGKLTGSIANIAVGGASESEQQEKRYRIEDALNATKSAIEEGIVEGGGIALLKAGEEMSSLQELSEYSVGREIVKKSLRVPIKCIAENGGKSGEAVIDKVLSSGLGYNALTDTYEDLIKAGIIDPLKVVRNEIQNAVSTASTLLTSNVAIATQDIKDDK